MYRQDKNRECQSVGPLPFSLSMYLIIMTFHHFVKFIFMFFAFILSLSIPLIPSVSLPIVKGLVLLFKAMNPLHGQIRTLTAHPKIAPYARRPSPHAALNNQNKSTHITSGASFGSVLKTCWPCTDSTGDVRGCPPDPGDAGGGSPQRDHAREHMVSKKHFHMSSYCAWCLVRKAETALDDPVRALDVTSKT